MVLDSYMNTDVKTSSAISISGVHVADTCNTYNLRSDVMQINYFTSEIHNEIIDTTDQMP